MFSKPWIIVASAGHGVLFSLALTGAIRFAYWLAGAQLDSATGNSIFGMTCLVAAPTAGYLQVARFVLPLPPAEES